MCSPRTPACHLGCLVLTVPGEMIANLEDAVQEGRIVKHAVPDLCSARSE